MIEGIGPELDGKVGTSKKSLDCVAKSSMSLFNRAILTRVVSTSREHSIFFLSKEISDFSVVEEFTPLIKIDIFVRTCRAVLGKEVHKSL